MMPQLRYALGVCLLVALAVFYTTGNQEPPRPKILGISHVRIRVSDFCKAKDFYSMVLGQHPYCLSNKKPIGGSVALHSAQSIGLNVNSLNAGSSLNQQSLLEEVGFITDDAAGLQQYLTSRNITVGEVGARPPSFVVHDPEGHRISFIERDTTPAQLRPDLPVQPKIIHAGFVVHDRVAVLVQRRQEPPFADDERGAVGLLLRQEAQHNEQMMKLYRQVVLKEKVEDAAGFVPLNGIAGIKPAPAPSKPSADREEVGSFGD